MVFTSVMNYDELTGGNFWVTNTKTLVVLVYNRNIAQKHIFHFRILPISELAFEDSH